MYKSKSCPCIEYASTDYYNEDENKTIDTLQNKFIEAADSCKRSTPMHALQMIAQIAPISCRIIQLILTHWFRVKCASEHHPLHSIMQQFDENPKPKNPQTTFEVVHAIFQTNETNIFLRLNASPPRGPTTELLMYEMLKFAFNYNIYPKLIKPKDIDPDEINI